MNRHVLIIDNSVFPAIYRPFDHWQRLLDGIPLTRIRAGAPLPPLDDFSHVIISGSEATITDPDPWVAPQLELIREAAHTGVPLFGSCHGHQLIALALAGPDHVRRAPEPELGWPVITVHEQGTLLAGVTPSITGFCLHFDEVVALPSRFRVLASSAHCAVHAFELEDAPIFGIQSHPEILADEGERLLTEFADIFPQIRGTPILRPARDSGLAQHLIERFLLERRRATR